jgi:hypothetical protein
MRSGGVLQALSFGILFAVSLFSTGYMASRLQNTWLKYAFVLGYGVAMLSTILGLFIHIPYLNVVLLRVGYAPIFVGQILAWTGFVFIPFGAVLYIVQKVEGARKKILVGFIGVCFLGILLVGLFDLTNQPIR